MTTIASGRASIAARTPPACGGMTFSMASARVGEFLVTLGAQLRDPSQSATGRGIRAFREDEQGVVLV